MAFTCTSLRSSLLKLLKPKTSLLSTQHSLHLKSTPPLCLHCKVHVLLLLATHVGITVYDCLPFPGPMIIKLIHMHQTVFAQHSQITLISLNLVKAVLKFITVLEDLERLGLSLQKL